MKMSPSISFATVSSPRFSTAYFRPKECIISHAIRRLQPSKPKPLVKAQAPLEVPATAATATTTSSSSPKARNKKAERDVYLFAALASTVGITSMAAGAVYYRFAWLMQGGETPWDEMFGTFSFTVGATVGMELWARWAHRALWHSSLWSMHQSHHRPREGPFELNDVFALINCVPAISLLAYGFFNKGLLPGLSFGAGLGITVYGMAYMFVHDGLVHKRFPVGPIEQVPYLQKVAAAHQLHHADKFNGIPYGLFLGPQEVQEVGGWEELERIIKARNPEPLEIQEQDKVRTNAERK